MEGGDAGSYMGIYMIWMGWSSTTEMAAQCFQDGSVPVYWCQALRINFPVGMGGLRDFSIPYKYFRYHGCSIPVTFCFRVRQMWN